MKQKQRKKNIIDTDGIWQILKVEARKPKAQISSSYRLRKIFIFIDPKNRVSFFFLFSIKSMKSEQIRSWVRIVGWLSDYRCRSSVRCHIYMVFIQIAACFVPHVSACVR